MNFPITLTISIELPTQTAAVDCVADLIDLEHALQSRQSKGEKRLCQSIRTARRKLQRLAGLVRGG